MLRVIMLHLRMVMLHLTMIMLALVVLCRLFLTPAEAEWQDHHDEERKRREPADAPNRRLVV